MGLPNVRMILQLNDRETALKQKRYHCILQSSIANTLIDVRKIQKKKENLTVRHINMFLIVLHKGSQNYKNQIVMHKIKIQIVIV